MQTRDEVLEQVKAALVELFEIEPERITLEARLNDDLEIDSIDAVDLLDRLRRQTGRKISADDFRSVRTVGDLVTAVHASCRREPGPRNSRSSLITGSMTSPPDG